MKNVFLSVVKLVVVIMAIVITVNFLSGMTSIKNAGKKAIIMGRDTGTVVSQQKSLAGPLVKVIYRNEIGNYIETNFDYEQVKIIDEEK